MFVSQLECNLSEIKFTSKLFDTKKCNFSIKLIKFLQTRVQKPLQIRISRIKCYLNLNRFNRVNRLCKSPNKKKKRVSEISILISFQRK